MNQIHIKQIFEEVNLCETEQKKKVQLTETVQ